MSLEYAPLGLVGVLTPQANTTVEPECGLLLPPGTGLLAARLVSPRATIEERLVEYFETLETAALQFAGVPLRALGFACTGSSYLAGRDREDDMLERVGRRLGCPAFSSASAVVEALQVLQARRIALVSPYPDSLTRHSIGYWQSRGFAIAAVAKVTGDASGRGHPIYGLGSDDALRALRSLQGQGPVDAVVMLGTGLPTLRAILEVPAVDGAPVISCTLALAWRCGAAVQGNAPGEGGLRDLVEGRAWRQRLADRVATLQGGTAFAP